MHIIFNNNYTYVISTIEYVFVTFSKTFFFVLIIVYGTIVFYNDKELLFIGFNK